MVPPAYPWPLIGKPERIRMPLGLASAPGSRSVRLASWATPAATAGLPISHWTRIASKRAKELGIAPKPGLGNVRSWTSFRTSGHPTAVGSFTKPLAARTGDTPGRQTSLSRLHWRNRKREVIIRCQSARPKDLTTHKRLDQHGPILVTNPGGQLWKSSP
jgi:hypothetical protein